jgi:putative Mg2+ transporter-C (MgtC) family protein
MLLASAGQVLGQEFGDLPTADEWLRILLRIGIAISLTGVLGWQRQYEHKPAGIRTHMLVALGSVVLMLVPERWGMSSSDLSRIIQGIVTGIGFVGGGAILKSENEHTVHGLTTAAGLWSATAIGVTAGLGRLWSACVIAAAAFFILSVMGRIEHALQEKAAPK